MRYNLFASEQAKCALDNKTVHEMVRHFRVFSARMETSHKRLRRNVGMSRSLGSRQCSKYTYLRHRVPPMSVLQETKLPLLVKLREVGENEEWGIRTLERARMVTGLNATTGPELSTLR